MTPKRAKELLPVMTAFSEGKTVQSSLGGKTGWTDETNPSFASAYEWRIKPEPREYWIVANKPAIHADVCFSMHDAESKMSTRNPTLSEIIHVREVL